MRKLLLCIILSFMFFSCKQNDVDNTRNKYSGFSLENAKDWVLVPLQGYDTNVGYLYKLSDTIHFDLGNLAFGNLDDIVEEPQFLFYEKTTINGVKAKIVKRKNENCITLSAFIDMEDKEHKNHLYVINPKNDTKFINIFKSHKFSK